MLATLIDSQLFRRGQTRLCFVKELGVKDEELALRNFNRLLQEGTQNEAGLKRLAEKLELDAQQLARANRVTVLLNATRQTRTAFVPYIEFVLQGYEEKPDSAMLLSQDQWKFVLPAAESEEEQGQRDFSGARRLYKKQFIAAKGRCLGRRIEGFRYYWAKDQAIEFDIYGLVKVIVPGREPPKKRFVSRHVLRAVGKPKLLVIHQR